MQPEGQVSALTAGDTLLGHFWDLASLEEDAREKAAAALVEALVASQAEFEAESGAEASDDDEAAANGGGGRARDVAAALRRCSPLVVYAFKRLCRGLGSSRQGARQGFSLAISALLGASQCIGPGEAVAAIEGVLEPVGKGSDLRDALLGRIFGYAAVIRSGRPLPAGLAGSMAAGLVAAAAKKSFLREVAGAVLLELCTAVDAATLAGLVEGASAPLAPWLTAPAADASPEALLLALRHWPRLPATAAAACPLLPGGFKAKQLPAALFSDPAAAAGSKAVAAAAAAFFTKQHLAALLPVLRATTAAHPRLHSVWPTLLALLIPGFSADKEQRDTGSGKAPARPAAAPLEAFWSTVVDGDLVASSHERKYLAFTLFQLLLPHLGPDQVALVFTPAFLRCLATNLKKGNSYLHAGAKKCAERIGGFCERMPEVRIAVALALQRHGGAELERFATGGAGKDKKGDKAKAAAAAEEAGGGKEAAAAADGAAAAGLQQYVRQLQDAFLSGGGGGEGAEAGGAGGAGGQQQRQWAVEQLCSVLKQRAAPAAVKLEVLRFLAVHALFSLDAAAAKKSKDAEVKAAAARSVDVPLSLRQLCAARLITLADSLDKQQAQHAQQAGGKGGKGGAPNAQQQREQQPRQEFLGGVAALVAKLQASGAATLATAAEGEEGAAEAAQEVAATLQRTLGRMQARLAGGGGAPAEQQRLRALTHLLRLLLLHTLADPASADASLAADLDTVVAIAIEGQAAPQRPAQPGGDGSDGSEEEEEEEEGGEGQAPHWHDTLMDVLLALLARNAAPLPSAPLRDAVEHAFRAFADGLTATGMGDMLRVLARPLDSSAQEDGDVYASSDEEEEEEGEGGMEVDGEEEEESGSEEEEEGSEGSEGSEEEQEEELKPAKGAAAAAAAKQAGSGSEEEGGSSEDEEGMSDEAMFRMDAKLASYFATLKEGKGGGGARAARDELVNFKMRVAGLVEAFCKRVPASPLLPGAVAPLLAGLAGASRPGGHQALAERLSGLITNKLCGCKAEAAGAGLEAAALEQQLRRCLYLASRSPDNRVAGAAWAAYVFLQRAATDDCRAKGEESAQAAAADFFSKKKSRLQRGQLEGLLRRVPALLPPVLPAVLKAAAAGRNEHLQLEAFHLLAASLKSAGSGAPKSLSGCGPAMAAAALAAVRGPFAKPQRQVEAVKLVCQALESGGGAAKLPAGKGGWQEVKMAEAAAQDSAANNPKLCAALARLEGMLAEAPVEQGKRSKGTAAPKGGPAKKQKT